MTPITCSIIKQYMWYHNKHKKWYNGNNIIVIYFKCSSMFYTIYENLDQNQFDIEKAKYGTTPTEHVINGNIYHAFSFYKINESTIMSKLQIDYNVFIIDIEKDKTWKERKDCLKQTKKMSLVSNIWSTFIDILYEPMTSSDSSFESSSDSFDRQKDTKKCDKKIPSFDNMILQQIINNNTEHIYPDDIIKNNNEQKEDNVGLPLNDSEQMKITAKRIMLEDEIVAIKGEITIDGDGLMSASDDELVEIKRNPMDRTYANIGMGKKIKFTKNQKK